VRLHLEKESNKFLILLLCADFVFIVVHICFDMNILSNGLFSIERDLGYAEIYQYIKEYWIVILLLILAIKNPNIVYCSWASLFTYFLLDDSLQIHAKLRHSLVSRFGFQPMFHLRARDFGELIVSLFFGFLLFTFISASHWYSRHRTQQISKNLFILVIFLVLFGVFVDMLHVAIPFWRVKKLCGLVEDGGEMVIMSLIVSYVFTLKLGSTSTAITQ
jgi:hypothetical protein